MPSSSSLISPEPPSFTPILPRIWKSLSPFRNPARVRFKIIQIRLQPLCRTSMPRPASFHLRAAPPCPALPHSTSLSANRTRLAFANRPDPYLQIEPDWPSRIARTRESSDSPPPNPLNRPDSPHRKPWSSPPDWPTDWPIALPSRIPPDWPIAPTGQSVVGGWGVWLETTTSSGGGIREGQSGVWLESSSQLAAGAGAGQGKEEERMTWPATWH